MTIPIAANGVSVGRRHFGGAELGDQRRTNALVTLADLMMFHPGGTLPQKLASPKDLKRLYRLMNDENVTHEAVFASHAAQTQAAMAEIDGPVVLIHDTTELDYTHKVSLDGIGPIGQGTNRGYICHQSLAVEVQGRRVLGLTSQILHKRAATAKKGSGTRRNPVPRKVMRDDPDRESLLWIEGLKNSGPARQGSQVIDVCDRGADTFEVLSYELCHNRSFVIRSRQRRKLVNPQGHNDAKELQEYARSLPARIHQTVQVQENAARIGRKALVAIGSKTSILH